jgi:hypothetical protein
MLIYYLNGIIPLHVKKSNNNSLPFIPYGQNETAAARIRKIS